MKKYLYFLPIIAALVVMVNTVYCEETGEAYFKGVEYAAQGKFEEAKQEFQNALSEESYYTAAKLELHAVEDVLNQKVKSETALFVFKGKEFAIKQMWKEAIDEYTKGIKSNPNYAYAFISRGIAYGTLGDFDKAISDFSEALDVNPQYTEAYHNRAVLLEYKGQFNKAITDFTKAIEADPNFAQLYLNRGLAYSYKNQFDRALPDFDKAIELKPDNAKAYINKAVACEKTGNKSGALEAYKKALQYDKSEDKEIAKDSDEAIKRLEAPPAEENKDVKKDDNKKDK